MRTFEEQIKFIQNKNKHSDIYPSEAYCLYGLKLDNRISRKHAVNIVFNILDQHKKDYEIVGTREQVRIFRKHIPVSIRKDPEFDYSNYPLSYIGTEHSAFTFEDDHDQQRIFYLVNNMIPMCINHRNKVHPITYETILRSMLACVAHERLHYRENHAKLQINDDIAEKKARERELSVLKQYDNDIYQQQLPFEDKMAKYFDLLDHC